MKVTRKIIKLGDSKVISLPLSINKKVEAKQKCLFEIKLIKNYSNPIIAYQCCACNKIFESVDEEVFCPICDDNPKIRRLELI